MHRRLSLLAALALSACTAPTLPQVREATAPVGDADLLAQQLAAAAQADAEDDLAALRNALAAIDEIGAKPSDKASITQLAAWRARLPEPLVTRGRALGPGYLSGAIGGGQEVTLEQTFLAGQSAAVAFSTAPARSLTLEISNDSTAVCSEAGPRRTCRWIPTFSARHAIVLRNSGKERVRYFLVID